jgi:hypothetical protein
MMNEEADAVMIRICAHSVLAILLTSAATLVSGACLGEAGHDKAATNQPAAPEFGTPAAAGARNADTDHFKILTEPGDGKVAKPCAAAGSGLSDQDLAKKILLRCRTHPGLCVKQRGEAKIEASRDPVLDKGMNDKNGAAAKRSSATLSKPSEM